MQKKKEVRMATSRIGRKREGSHLEEEQVKEDLPDMDRDWRKCDSISLRGAELNTKGRKQTSNRKVYDSLESRPRRRSRILESPKSER